MFVRNDISFLSNVIATLYKRYNMTNINFNPEEVSFKRIFESFKYWPMVFKLFWKFNYKYFSAIVFLNILTGIMPIINIAVTRDLIYKVTNRDDINFNSALWCIILLIIVSIFNNIVSSLKNYFEDLFQNIVDYNLNGDIMEKANKLSLSDFENSEIYDKLQRAQKEAGYRPFGMFTSILFIISGVITLISSVTIIFIWNWWVAIILILAPSLSTISLLKYGQKEFLTHWKRASESRQAWYFSYLLTADVNCKEIKLCNLGEHLIERYRKIFHGFYKEDKNLARKRITITIIFDLINELVVGAVILIIAYSTFVGNLFIGDFYTYLSSAKLIRLNSQTLLNALFNMYRDNLYIKQLFDFLELPANDDTRSEAALEIAFDEITHIEFNNVSFKYPNSNRYALKNLNLKLCKGEKIAIVGENGSGKTTFIKILTRLYDSYEGEILINGISIKRFNVNYIRNKMSVVFQDFIKYELTVRENIGFGNLKVLNSDDEILNSAQLSGIDQFVIKLPKGVDNQLGSWFDGGVQLSGGQWQKIALARAFIKDSDIYVFDEPTSALDPLSEKEIFDKFFQLSEDKIGIFTSHRFSTVRYASQILVFKEGELLEHGNHEQLMNLQGYYYKLYNIQAMPFQSTKYA